MFVLLLKFFQFIFSFEFKVCTLVSIAFGLLGSNVNLTSNYVSTTLRAHFTDIFKKMEEKREIDPLEESINWGKFIEFDEIMCTVPICELTGSICQ